MITDARRSWWRPSRRPPEDDAYTAWFNAHSRCTQALRAWSTAPLGQRAAAFRTYVEELELEEAAAAELRRLHLIRAEAWSTGFA
jgi:hypothetical protein